MAFLRAAVAYFAGLGVTLAACSRQRLGLPVQAFRRRLPPSRLKHSFTRPYRPQTNGKAERFIQSALREWAYGIPYQHSTKPPPCSSAGRVITTGIARTTALEVSRHARSPAAETTS